MHLCLHCPRTMIVWLASCFKSIIFPMCSLCDYDMLFVPYWINLLLNELCITSWVSDQSRGQDKDKAQYWVARKFTSDGVLRG